MNTLKPIYGIFLGVTITTALVLGTGCVVGRMEISNWRYSLIHFQAKTHPRLITLVKQSLEDGYISNREAKLIDQAEDEIRHGDSKKELMNWLKI